jgi:hypothetical protein
MKRTILSLFSVCSWAQDYFVFIQAVTGQPFYVRIGENSYSSSAGGHIILSPVKDSLYNMYIGFPRSRYPEQLFTVEVNRKDRGFELKNVNGSWQLYDLQTQQILRAANTEQVHAMKIRRSDSYSQLMADVVDDTAVLYSDTVSIDSVAAVAVAKDTVKVDTLKTEIAVAKPQKKKKKKGVVVRDSANAVVFIDSVRIDSRDTAGVKNKEVLKDGSVVKKDSVRSAAVDNLSNAVKGDSSVGEAGKPVTSVRDKRDIIRFSTENIVEGKMIIYLDRTGVVTDTIRIIIPRL